MRNPLHLLALRFSMTPRLMPDPFRIVTLLPCLAVTVGQWLAEGIR